MARVKRGVMSMKHRRNVLKAAKGYRNGRSNKEIEAKVALRKAGVYAFAHRKDKKNDFRRLWTVKINAALDVLGLSFSKFIGAMRKDGVALDKKILSDLAVNNIETFNRVASAYKTA